MLTVVTHPAGLVSYEVSHPAPSRWRRKLCQVSRGTLLTWELQDMAHSLPDLLASTGCDSIVLLPPRDIKYVAIPRHYTQFLTQPCPPFHNSCQLPLEAYTEGL